MNSRILKAYALLSGVVMGVALPTAAHAAGEAAEVTDTFTALAADVTTMGLALLALVAGGVVIGLAIRFVTKGKKAASGV